MTPGPPSAATPAPARRARWKLPAIVAGVLVVPVAGVALYVMAALQWSYSDGQRAGVLQKFSRKGWICKTYEGELAMTTVPGVAPTIWEFSVHDTEIARGLSDVVGNKVMLHYTEHRGVPTKCFGQTPYYVDGFKAIP